MLSKSLQVEDYKDIPNGIRTVIYGMADAKGKGLRIDIPHEHRFWEYGSAMEAFLSKYPRTNAYVRCLDIGGGQGLMGPAIRVTYPNAIITESEVDEEVINKRKPVQEEYNIKSILVNFGEVPEGRYDLVTCMSVIEHDPNWRELLTKMVDRVATGGVIVITTDYKDKWPDKQIRYDNVLDRENLFTPADMMEAVEIMRKGEIEIDAEFTYHGDKIANYTFYRLVGVKKNGNC